MAAAAEIGSPDFKASYGACGPARSFDGQKGLAAEAILHLGKQKNIELASKRAPVPPVQQPGVYSPRGADNEAEIASLKREMETAVGKKAERLGFRLLQLQRQAGML